MNKSILLDEKDNVVTVLENLKIGDSLSIYDMENNFIEKVEIIEDIPYGNKIATRDIGEKESAIKYGEKIGMAIRDIKKHELVHVHNIKSYNIDIPESVKAEVMKQMNIR